MSQLLLFHAGAHEVPGAASSSARAPRATASGRPAFFSQASRAIRRSQLREGKVSWQFNLRRRLNISAACGLAEYSTRCGTWPPCAARSECRALQDLDDFVVAQRRAAILVFHQIENGFFHAGVAQ